MNCSLGWAVELFTSDHGTGETVALIGGDVMCVIMEDKLWVQLG